VNLFVPGAVLKRKKAARRREAKMRHYFQRKSAPKVQGGRVQHKNHWTRTPRYHRPEGSDVVIYRERPGEGYRHVLRQPDVEQFLALLPDWEALSEGLQAIVLAPGNPSCLGWHNPGIVAVCAWERELIQAWFPEFFADHRSILERLGVEWEPIQEDGETRFLCKFTEQSVRGFLLMHVLLHELGHHHDRMNTRSRKDCGRGEDYAEQYALQHADQLWERYFRVFGW
jgi:hypothetical protein